MSTITDDTAARIAAGLTQKSDQVVQWVDPNTVKVHPMNARRDLGNLEKLTASVRELGVIEPCTTALFDGDDEPCLIFGHRRRGAAIAAERLLPVIFRPDLDGNTAGQLLEQLAENENREDLALTELGQAYQRLFDLGVTSGVIAVATGREAEEITAMATVGKSDAAVALTERYELTLEQAVAVAEFDDDREAIKALTVAAKSGSTWQFEHLVATLRRDREDQAQVESLLEKLRSEETTILDASPSAPAMLLGDLTTDKDKKITPATHRKCPGHAAFIEATLNGRRIVYVCTDPKANGHKVPRAAARTQAAKAAKPAKKQAEETQARRDLMANNKAMDIATPVRRKFVAELLKRRAKVVGLAEYVVSSFVMHTRQFVDPDEAVWEELTDKKPVEVWWYWQDTVGGAVLENRRTDFDWLMAGLSLVCAGREKTWHKNTWRNADPGDAAYLRFLESVGYELAEVELLLCTTAEAE